MKAWILGFAVPGLLFAQTPEVLKVEGKDLPVVPGPLINREHFKDPVSPLGNSATDLKIRRSSRSMGAVPAVAVPAGDVAVAHQVNYPSGWQAYRVDAAAGETIKARLRGDHEAWFVVHCMTRMGGLAPGMLQNRIPTGNPEASYRNLGKGPATVYFVVDTTEIITGSEPYTLTFTRSR